MGLGTRAVAKDMVDDYTGGLSFYADMCTGTIPTDPTAVSTRADLTLATGGNYAPVALSSITTANDGNGAIIDAADPVWSGVYTNGTNITYLAILVGTAGSPSSSDRVVAVLPRVTSATVASVTTTNGSATITSSAAFGSIVNDQNISGTGIPSGTFVLDKVDSSTIRMSQRATASGTITLTYLAASSYTPGSSAGAAQNVTWTLPATGFYKIG